MFEIDLDEEGKMRLVEKGEYGLEKEARLNRIIANEMPAGYTRVTRKLAQYGW